MISVFFSGIGCEDIIMHLAKLLSAAGKETAISDEEGSYSYSQIPVIGREFKESPGYLLVNGAGRRDKDGAYDLRILVTDLQPLNARKWGNSKAGTEAGDWNAVIVRDRRKDRKAADYIMNLLKLRCSMTFITESIEDCEIRCCLQEGIRYRLKDLGESMLTGLCETAEIITGSPAKSYKKSIGREKKWERSLYSGPTLKERDV